MIRYKFSQFNVEIIDPSVEIDMNTIGDKALDCLLSVDVLLTVGNAKFGVRLEDMPYESNWLNEDVPGMVAQKLLEYECIS